MNRYLLVAVLVLAAILVLVLLFILARVLLRGWRRQLEKGALLRDLLLWRNLSSLVLGGDESRRAKADISSRIGRLRELFTAGLKSKRGQHGDRDLPWLLFVGEPDSGKTTLLANAGLEFHSSVRNDTAEKLPLLPWVSPFAYALDVGGRVFFDRWLEGSGAEWDETISLVGRARRSRPLDGVVLCVPADALLADGDALVREKTSLVSSELHRLVMRLGVNVPVHVVVTKCDMLLGWRELFAGLSDAERTEAFGWRHGDPAAAFDASEFDGWWWNAVGSLKSCVVAHLADVGQDERSDRLSTATRAYLLPDSFESLRANLVVYLARIFGVESWHGREHLMLSGVFFTSAADTGTVLSAEYAALAGRKAEEMPLVSEPVEVYGGHFVRNLLHDFVAGRRIPAAFTERARFRRQLPGYLLAAGLVAISVYWLLLSFGRGEGLSRRLEPATEFYRGVAGRFEQGDFAESPLFGMDEKGNVTLFEHESMRSEPGITRIRYLHLAKSFAQKSVNLAPGWWLASRLRFNFDGDAGGALRRAVYNDIQSQMAFEPVVLCFERYEDLHGGKTFDLVRRDAFKAYNAISARSKSDRSSVDIGCFITYLMPAINPDLLQLLRTFYSADGGSWRAHTAMLAYDLDYIRTERRLYGDFFKAWSDLTIYPETAYPVMRGLITNSVAYLRDNRTVVGQAAAVAAGSPTNAAVLADWRETLRQQLGRVRRVNEGYANSQRLELAFDPEQGVRGVASPGQEAPVQKTPDAAVPYVLRDPVRESIEEYRGLLRRDRSALEKDVAGAASHFSGHAAYAYYKTLGAEQLDAHFAEISRRLDKEAAVLLADAVELRTGGMLRQLRDQPKDAKPDAMEPVATAYVFDVLANLYGAAFRALSDDHVTDPEKLGELLERETSRAAFVREALAAAAGPWGTDPLVAPLLASLRCLTAAQSEENWLRLLREYVAVHPRTVRDIGDLAAAIAGKSAGTTSVPLADVVGEVTQDPRYAPDGVREILLAYAQIRGLMRPKAPEKGEAAAPVRPPDVPGYGRFEASVDEYVGSYIDHLARRIDGLSARFGESWADFRSQCVQIKPYAVNAVLQSGYAHVREELKAIPDGALSSDMRKMRDAALARVEGRMKLLTSDFSETCVRQAASWSLLSQDPVLAAKCLRELPAKALMNDYLALLGAEEKSRIPWWDDFFSRGLALAQGEALVKGVASLRKEGCKYMRFPLCRDPVVTDEILTDEGLSHANDALLSCGCAPVADEGAKEPPQTAGKPAPETDESAHPVLKRVRGTAVLADANGSRRQPPIDLERGSAMLRLIEALTVRRFQTVWTLSVPPLAERLELQRRHYPTLPLSTFRFRYGEVMVGGKRRGEPTALDSKAAVVLARGDLGDFDLRIRLKEFSDSSDVAAELDYPGPWAILRPYFAEGAVVREKDRAVLLPLVAVDRNGLKSVFWVEIAFSRPMPSPNDWPSTEQWIDTPVSKRQDVKPEK